MSRDRRMRTGSSIAAMNASAVSWPTPGMVISRRQATEALVIRLTSASIAATAAITAVRAAIRPRMAADRPVIPSLALSACFTKATVKARESRMPNTTAEASDLVLQGDPLADQLLARDDQRSKSMRRQRLHMNGLEEASAGKMRQAARIIAIGPVRRQRLQCLIGLTALDAHDGQTQLAQAMVEHRRHPAGLEYDATTTWRFRQLICDRLRHRRCLTLTNDHAFAVDNADVGLIHRDIEASKIVH